MGQFGATELCVYADRIVKVTTPATDVTSIDASAAGAKDAAQIPAYRLVQDVTIEKIRRRWPRPGTGRATPPASP